MFEYITGKITDCKPTCVVVDNGGIGYFVQISLHTYSAISSLKDVKLYIHQIIREDANPLYGFFSLHEREVFRHLISVSGIGANTARMMHSSLRPEEIEKALITGDVNLIKSVKGIGTKTAQRAIVELKDKMGKMDAGHEIFIDQYNTIKEEALSALVMLGFNKIQSEKAIHKIAIENTSIGVEELIKEALKRL